MGLKSARSIKPAAAEVQQAGPPRGDDPLRRPTPATQHDDDQPAPPAPAATATPPAQSQPGTSATVDAPEVPQPPSPPRATQGGRRRQATKPQTPVSDAATGTSGKLADAEQDGQAGEAVTAAAIYGERVQRSVMMPTDLWLSYRALADDLSTPRRRISGNDLVLAVLLVHAPETVAEADQLVGEWEDLLATDEGPGYGPAVQRPVRLYESQIEHLRQLDRQLSARRVQGARSKVICAVLHFRRPSDHDAARQLLAAVRAAERAAPGRVAA